MVQAGGMPVDKHAPSHTRPPPRSATRARRARPQVHGHDFSCVAALPLSRDDGHAGFGAAAPAQVRYASGSEEKVLRVLEAPQAFHDTLALARGGGAAGSERQVGFLKP